MIDLPGPSPLDRLHRFRLDLPGPSLLDCPHRFRRDLPGSFLSHQWLIEIANWMYFNSHFVVTISFLAWLYLFRSENFNFVRNTSATELTVTLLRKMEEQLTHYSRRNDGHLPVVAGFDPQPGNGEDVALIRSARQNNEDLVRALENLSYEFPTELEAKAFLAFHLWDSNGKGLPIHSRGTPPRGRSPPPRRHRTRRDPWSAGTAPSLRSRPS